MRGLSDNSDQTYLQEENHKAQMSKLQDEVKEWKSRYTKTRTQLRSLRAASIGLPGNMDIMKESTFSDPDGLVSDIQVTKFQVLIDELLRTARNDLKNILNFMSTIVDATSNMTRGIDEESDPEWIKLKTRVSATANNLVTAIRNHSMAGGLSPVSLIDAAASHLTAAVMELVRTVKIRPTPADELENGDIHDEHDETYDTNQQSLKMMPENLKNGFSPARSSIDSVYSSSSISSPRFSNLNTHPRNASGNWGSKREGKISTINPLGIDSIRTPAFGIRTDESDVEELKVFKPLN